MIMVFGYVLLMILMLPASDVAPAPADSSSQAETSGSSAGKETFTTINSCLCPLGSVDGASITTVEGIGNSKAGYHAVQGWCQPLDAALSQQYMHDDHMQRCDDDTDHAC